ncbi:glycosyltransferase family 90 protein [Atractiella rhizophila]|nr:glycosyltransferase family 90 protein [Atractiella rhizophila]
MSSLGIPTHNYPLTTTSKKRLPYAPPRTPTYDPTSPSTSSHPHSLPYNSSSNEPTESSYFLSSPSDPAPNPNIPSLRASPTSTPLSLLSRLFRKRLHPLSLIPAFILGLLAVSLLGQGEAQNLRFEVGGVGFSLGSGGGGAGGGQGGEEYVHHASGHVFWNGKGRHPIFGLVANASQAWDLKVRRQSKTLDQAVREYIKRNGRRPPKGFAEWFNFAKQNNIVLIDEYTQIARDVHPFLSLPPALLQKRSEQVQNEQYTFTLNVPEDKKAEVTITGNRRELARAKDLKDLMKRWVKYVPGGVKLTMTEHDGPSVLLDSAQKERMSQAAREGRLLAESDWERKDDDVTQWGFNLACPPSSRLRRAYDGLESGDVLPRGQSFVSDQVKAMDLCQNPEWQMLHGFTSWKGPRPALSRPLFTMSKMSLHSDILVPPLEQYRDLARTDTAWEEKTRNTTFVWRGSTTGVWFNRDTRWRSSQRMRLYWMKTDPNPRPVTFLSSDGSTRRENVPTKELMERYADFAFSGLMAQCDEDGTCKAVKELIKWEEKGMIWDEQNWYKFQLDVDGNAWSGRFHRLLSSNSAIIKSTIFPEWYTDRIQPWLHFIPLKVDYSDLFDIMAFFNGDMDGKGGRDDMAKKIGEEGKKWAREHWRWEDMEAYFFLLTLEWARVMADDRSAFDFKG